MWSRMPILFPFWLCRVESDSDILVISQYQEPSDSRFWPVSIRSISTIYLEIRTPTVDVLTYSFRGTVRISQNYSIKVVRNTNIESYHGSSAIHGIINVESGFRWPNARRSLISRLETFPKHFSIRNRFSLNLSIQRYAQIPYAQYIRWEDCSQSWKIAILYGILEFLSCSSMFYTKHTIANIIRDTVGYWQMSVVSDNRKKANKCLDNTF